LATSLQRITIEQLVEFISVDWTFPLSLYECCVNFAGKHHYHRFSDCYLL